MRLAIIAVGRMRDKAEKALYERYGAGIALNEVEEKRKLPAAELKRAEAQLIRNAIPKGAITVALDRRGRTLSSEELAERVTRWQREGKTVAFIIGGAEGLDDSLRDSTDFVLSLGAATWPHMLARIMLVEQLYRACAIISGHPYHRADEPGKMARQKSTKR
jgi:23S rRNA (pseudouridine1915-N3)-methyltransferase